MAASGLGAGPWTTEPSLMLYLLPWHGQLMVPFETLLTMQPWCVQIAVNALNDPDLRLRDHDVHAVDDLATAIRNLGGGGKGAGRGERCQLAGAPLPAAEVAVPPAAGVLPPLLASCVVHPASIAAHVTPAPASSARRLGFGAGCPEFLSSPESIRS